MNAILKFDPFRPADQRVACGWSAIYGPWAYVISLVHDEGYTAAIKNMTKRDPVAYTGPFPKFIEAQRVCQEHANHVAN